MGHLPAKEDKEFHKAAQQWSWDAKTKALHSKLFPSKVLFEGSNKNLIVFTQKNLKNQQFLYSNKTNNWYNVFTQRGLMIQKSDSASLVAGLNVVTGK